MTNVPELKPCPFCGGATFQDDFSLNAFICADCGAVGPEGHSGEYAERWNSRAAIAPEMAAEALKKEFLEGKFEKTGDAAMQDLIEQGVTCQYTLIENWLNAIAEQKNRENRWEGYSSPRGLQAMCKYVHSDQERMPFPRGARNDNR